MRPPETVYRGVRDRDGCTVVADSPYTQFAEALPLRLDLANHSPTGFEWGYLGSGPAQLALALLADCLGDDQEALRLHQKFKANVVSQIQAETWRMTAGKIQELAALYGLEARA